jgi:hypothetical protein
MKVRRWACCALPLLAVALADGRAVPEEVKKGIVAFVDGDVKKQPPASEIWESAPLKSAVNSGEKVRTYQQSRAELELVQLDIIRLAPKTIVALDKLYEETKEKKLQTQIQVESGEIWASVHEVNAETEFDISAPVAAAAITGTVLRMRVDDDSTTQLKVYKGEVRITNAPERTDLSPTSIRPYQVQGPRPVQGPREVSLEEWVYIVKSMQQITIGPRGQVVSTGEFKSRDPDENTPWVQWNKKREEARLKRIQSLLPKSP